MNTNLLTLVAGLSDEALLERMRALAQRSRHVTVELIAHLVEVARRGLHRAEGPGRLFGYLTQVLRFSDAAAWNRIQAARAVRRFPVVLDLLADGSVNLTTIRLLGPHLTRENHLTVLAEATGKSTREIKKIAARLAPKPDVPSSIRKLPDAHPTTEASSLPSVAEAAPPSSLSGPPASARSVPAPASPESHRPVVAPLAPQRYRLQLTMDEEMHDDLECLQDLMRREIPDGDPGAIVRQALKLLRSVQQKKAFAETPTPRPSRGSRPGSRHVEAAVRRAVWKRDGGQCAFLGRGGVRCTERSFLEFHHEDPYAFGGGNTAENISLRCRAHNVYEAELVFGPDVVREPRARYGATVCFETNAPTPRRAPMAT